MRRKEDQGMGEDASPDESRKLGSRVNHNDSQETGMQPMLA